jgi:hypothetical protein
MEDTMCYAKDYNLFDDEKKAEDTQVVTTYLRSFERSLWFQKAAMQGTPTSQKMGNRPELVDS